MPMLRDLIRELLNRAFPTDSSLEAFCLDYFPDAYARFSEGMNEFLLYRNFFRNCLDINAYRPLSCSRLTLKSSPCKSIWSNSVSYTCLSGTGLLYTGLSLAGCGSGEEYAALSSFPPSSELRQSYCFHEQQVSADGTSRPNRCASAVRAAPKAARIDRISPEFGPNDRTTPVEIIGENLEQLREIWVGGVPVTNLTRIDARTCRGLVPAQTHQVGAVDISFIDTEGSNKNTRLRFFYRAKNIDFLLQSASTGYTLFSFAQEDFNLDGHADIATISDIEEPVSVLLGTGNGQITDIVDSFLTGPGASSIAASDLDHDRVPDLVVGGRQLFVLKGRGDGRFSLKQSFGTSGSYSDIQIADINHDGNLDILAINRAANSLEILHGSSSGTFSLEKSETVCESPQAAAIGHFNEDNLLDLAVTCEKERGITFLLGSEHGRLARSSWSSLEFTPWALTAAQLNPAGPYELFVTSPTTDQLVRLTRALDGRYIASRSYPVGKIPIAVTAEDVTGDARKELIVANFGSNDITLLTNDGSGRFDKSIQIATYSKPTKALVADFNEDKRPDIAVSSFGGSRVSFLINHSD